MSVVASVAVELGEVIGHVLAAPQFAERPRSGTVISRRHVLTTGLGIGAAILWGGRTGGTSHANQHGSPPASAGGGNPTGTPPGSAPLIESEVRQSAGGQLRTTLRVRYAYQDIGGYRLHLRSYDGMTPGPTLRARPGDVLRIRLVNELPPNRDPLPHDHNLPNRLNTTNLHTHGLHVSPDGIADNVMRDMEPGQTYEIEVPIPASHPPGTYWYHPHRHGSANVQVASGMAGALILEGDFASVPQIARARERVLILQQLAFDALGTVESFDTVWPKQAARLFTVNGQLEPTIAMRPGEVQRWRILHAGFHDSTPIRQSRRGRSSIPHPHQSVPGHADRWSGAGGAGLAGHRERAGTRQRDAALSLRGLHGPLRAPLPHLQPRGHRHDAARRGPQVTEVRHSPPRRCPGVRLR